MRLGSACAAIAVVLALQGLAVGLTVPVASAETAGPLARDPVVTRLAGPGQYATAAAISQGSFPGTTDDLSIVSGVDRPDGLSAGAAVASVDGVLLPVKADDLPDIILEDVNRLQPKQVSIIGVPRVVSDAVKNSLRTSDYDTIRIGGANRDETAADVVGKFFDLRRAGAYYAFGTGFADAPTSGAAAAHRGDPLLLTASAKSSVTRLVPGDRVALGGPAALSEAAVAELGAPRVFGDDANANAVSKDAFPSARTAYLANGLKFPDALSATPAASRDAASILLTHPTSVTPGTATGATRLGATSRIVVGGTTAVSAAAANLLVCAPEPEVRPPP